MNEHRAPGISRQGLDSAFEARETLKANLLLEAKLLLDLQSVDEAVPKLVQAAEIEEELASICAEKGLREKAWIHASSAAFCWARVGNFHEAFRVGKELLADDQLPLKLRRQMETLTDSIQARRVHWASEPKLALV